MAVGSTIFVGGGMTLYPGFAWGLARGAAAA
jgi:hypothetical protein